jgi:hypothetical protein
MLQHSREFAAGIPFIFDPGQGHAAVQRQGADAQMIEQATYVTVNDYESSLLQERTGWSERDIASKVQAYIITRGPRVRGAQPSRHPCEIPAATAHRVVDPDRLRRRLSRRPDLRPDERHGHGHRRPRRLADGRDQDRTPRPAEPQLCDRH